MLIVADRSELTGRLIRLRRIETSTGRASKDGGGRNDARYMITTLWAGRQDVAEQRQGRTAQLTPSQPPVSPTGFVAPCRRLFSSPGRPPSSSDQGIYVMPGGRPVFDEGRQAYVDGMGVTIKSDLNGQGEKQK